jgi:hypothetical protein
MKIRRLVNASLRLPACSPEELQLPPETEVTGEALLQFHVNSLLGSGLYAPCPSYRATKKTPLPTRLLLESLVKKPDGVLMEQPLSWSERRGAGHFVATVFAHHYGMTVRRARDKMRHCWKGMRPTCRSNWWLLSQRVAAPGPKQETLEERALRQDIESYGVLLTWQSSWGRKHDVVQQLLAHGVSEKDRTDICRRDPQLQEAFEQFAKWIAVSSKRLGFEKWSAAMELNSATAGQNKVHFHAYMARDWRQWKKGSWGKVSFRLAQMQYDCREPHASCSIIRQNANPTKVLAAGLYYQLAPKRGSIFCSGNCTIAKDTLKQAKASDRNAVLAQGGEWEGVQGALQQPDARCGGNASFR